MREGRKVPRDTVRAKLKTNGWDFPSRPRKKGHVRSRVQVIWRDHLSNFNCPYSLKHQVSVSNAGTPPSPLDCFSLSSSWGRPPKYPASHNPHKSSSGRNAEHRGQASKGTGPWPA